MVLSRRALPLVVALTLLAPLGPDVALASCLQESIADQAARAEVIAINTITETRQTFVAASGVIRFRPERVLKGSLSREVQVYLGPTHGGAITSVDYSAVTRGERQTLYLRAVDDGSYETNACSGSHAGGTTADEEKALGKGTLVAAASDEPLSWILPVGALLVLALAAAALVAVRRRRATTS